MDGVGASSTSWTPFSQLSRCPRIRVKSKAGLDQVEFFRAAQQRRLEFVWNRPTGRGFDHVDDAPATGAYWLMLALRDAIPRATPFARAECATPRLRLLKIAARVVERADRVRIHFACPDAAFFRLLAGRLAAAGP